MEEEWRDIEGYEGFYQVSNMGRVKRLEHIDKNKHRYCERILKNAPMSHAGYKHVHLCKDGIAKWQSVHRLVASAFVEKRDGCDIVNHLDNNPANNNAENLEWTTYKGNMQHAARQGRMKGCPRNLVKAQEAHKIPVYAIKNGEKIWFPSGADAGRSLGVTAGHIAACCRKEYGYNRLKGYEFEYADAELQKKQKPNKVKMPDEVRLEKLRQLMIGNKYGVGKKYTEEEIERMRRKRTKPVIQYSMSGEYIAEYYSAAEAFRVTGITHIDDCARGSRKSAGKYMWKYKE